ncbi:MAG: circularly permuted type 2 ATP-grasp protein [Anaerolineae bacterium]|nr:circularly permuted type 2 ATP-grasp protein [Anaerolineae bacterium]
MSWDALQEGIDHYHSLLDDQFAADSFEAMSRDLRVRKLYFGERPLCTVLRPHFYTPDQWAHLKSETELVLQAFAKAHIACLNDASLRAQLFLEPYEEQLFSIDIGFEFPWTTSRLDSFYTLDDLGLRFVEYNAETPAGMAYEDQLAECFLGLELMKRFQEKYQVRSFPMRASLLGTLLDSHWQFSGNREMPQIGIVDWGDVPTLTEHQLCQQYFEERGTKTILADPRALEYHHDALWAGDFRIDLIYKRVLCSELIQRMGMDNPIVKAVRDGNVSMQNAFSAKLMAKKASFAVLSDERNAHLFSDEECRAIEEHIPWTRNVSDRKTVFHGQEIDLLSYVAEHRDQFVLKPNDEYGGKGVLIGWETTSEVWNEALNFALTNPYVVQERVRIAYEDFPTVIDDKLNISNRLVDADPFIFKGKTVSGALTRLSSVTLLNVTAGGGSVVPTFVIQKKD